MVFAASTEGTAYQLFFGVRDSGWRLCPYTSKNLALGGASYLWGAIYSSSSTISTSDAREKENIVDIDERYEKLFMKLRGVNYMWRNYDPNDPVTHDRIHCGLIAQEVEEACTEVGLDAMSFATLCHDELEVPTYDGRTERYGLAYSELHGLEIHMIQKNVNAIDELKSQIAALQEQLAELQASA
ncbi:MAG: tail fiber domain-containing protein [Clostridiales bacterium]|nr:tail fiber domain-containing protein [Clostridiales bacterium]